jgi:hypothetical protein
MKFSKSVFWINIVAVFLVGILIGLFDFNYGGVYLTAIIFIIPNAILGYFRPNLAWFGASSCGIGYIVIYFYLGFAMGMKPAQWPSPSLFAALLTVIPGFIGAYWGAAMKWILTSARRLKEGSQNIN